MASYLKTLKTDISFSGGSFCELSLPNREISFVYKKEILDRLSVILPKSTAIYIQEALYSSNSNALQEQLRNLLLQAASSFDTAQEVFYHGLVLGLCAMMDDRYYISSNRESGEGRYVIQLLPKIADLPGILIELKAGKNADSEKLDELTRLALQQIRSKKYETEMCRMGINNIVCYGVAFCGKQVRVRIEEF